MRLGARYVVGLLALCLSPRAAALPLSWVENEREPILEAPQVLQIAHRYLGADALYDIPPPPTFVDFTDREPMGIEVDAAPAWIVTIDGLDLVHARSKETVRTTLYMAIADSTGQLLCVYTDVRPDDLPSEELTATSPNRPSETLASPGDSQPVSSVTSVLGTLMYHGFDVASAGQVIVRPRLATSDWPGREPYRGRFLPESSPALWWAAVVITKQCMGRYRGTDCAKGKFWMVHDLDHAVGMGHRLYEGEPAAN